MPNHVTNILTITTDTEERLAEILNFIKGDYHKNWEGKMVQSPISFFKWIPQIDDLYRTPESVTNKNWDEIPVETRTSLTNQIADENTKKYGFSSWYDYNRYHFGTKWDAYDAYEEDGAIWFNTAWSTADRAILALSRHFPDAIFHVVFGDEDCGYNAGEYTCENGEFTEYYEPEGGSDDAWQYYFTTHPGAEEDFYKNEDGKWVFDEE